MTVIPQPVRWRRSRLRALFVISLITAASLGVARADPLSIERVLSHPDGVTIRLAGIELSEAAIVLSATISNPGSGEVRLNGARSLVIDDGAHGVHFLNPPLGNPEMRIPPRSVMRADLVFVGPPPSAARHLTLSINRGIGTPDNPYDTAPAFEASLPLPQREGSAAAAGHPDGAALAVRHIAAGGGICLVTIVAANGNDSTIVLNEAGSLVLLDAAGRAARLDPPTENRELVIPSEARLDADLVFDCRGIDTGGVLRLISNRGTAGTPDNPYDTMPVLRVTAPVEPAAATLPGHSHAAVTPLPQSQLSPIVPAMASAASDAPRRPAAAPPPAASAPTEPPPPPPAPTEPLPPPPVADQPAATREGPASLAQLEAALHAAKTDRGLRLVLPADALFQPRQREFDAAAAAPLASLAALVAAARPREIVVIGHTDSSGDDDANLALSKAQAHAVAAWLKAHAPPQHRLRFVEEGYGRTRPVAPNHNADGSDNPAGRASNRRIEILLRQR
ncbi:MAG: OmpA family protein [Thiohalocapsa sp.]